jgi:Uma2 family endonuclease
MTLEALAQATYDDILALPEGVTGEIIFGVLHTQPQPRPRHASAASRLAGVLGGPFSLGKDGPGGWWIIAEPEVHSGGHVLVPDLAGWRVERMAELPDAAYFSLVPDWVCEILSPSTAKRDRGVKMEVYAELGVGHLWLIDADLRVLEVFRLEGTRWMRLGAFADDALCRPEPFDGVEMDLGALWRSPVHV